METCPICSFDIFGRLAGQEVDDLNNIVTRKEYAKGQVVFHQDEAPAKLHLLFEGQLKSVRYSEDGKETILHTIEAGEPFALVPYFLDIPYTGTCVALKECVTGELSRSDFLDVLQRHPEVSLKIMASLAQRTKELLTRVEDQTSRPPKERLMHYLETESRSRQSSTYELALSKADLARVLGMEPETLSRCLATLVKEGFLEVDKKTVSLL